MFYLEKNKTESRRHGGSGPVLDALAQEREYCFTQNEMFAILKAVYSKKEL